MIQQKLPKSSHRHQNLVIIIRCLVSRCDNQPRIVTSPTIFSPWWAELLKVPYRGPILGLWIDHRRFFKAFYLTLTATNTKILKTHRNCPYLNPIVSLVPLSLKIKRKEKKVTLQVLHLKKKKRGDTKRASMIYFIATFGIHWRSLYYSCMEFVVRMYGFYYERKNFLFSFFFLWMKFFPLNKLRKERKEFLKE